MQKENKILISALLVLFVSFLSYNLLDTITGKFVPVFVDNAQFNSQNVPTTLTTGQTVQVSVTMLNSGTTFWIKGQLYRLGSQNPQDNNVWGISRVELSDFDNIGFNQPKTFTFTITAPSTPGQYNFQWRMLKEGVAWFGEFSPNVVINVQAPVQQKPDLSVLDLYFEDLNGNIVTLPKIGDKVNPTIKFVNKGYLFTNNFNINYEIKKDGVIIKSGSNTYTGGLRSQQEGSFKVYSPGYEITLQSGIYCFDATLDSTNVLQETDENNNKLSPVCITVQAPVQQPTTTYLLTVNKQGQGSGNILSNPYAINCGAYCTSTFPESTLVTLTPTPSADSVFQGWSGACTGTGSCTVTMDSTKTVTATFKKLITTTPQTSLPDLIIESLDFTDPEGNIISSLIPLPISFNLRFKVKNIGTSTATLPNIGARENPNAYLFVSRNLKVNGVESGGKSMNIYDAVSFFYDSISNTVSLGPEKSTGEKRFIENFHTTPGNYCFDLKLDPENRVVESDEVNNVITRCIRLEAPVQQTTTITKPDLVIKNAGFKVNGKFADTAFEGDLIEPFVIIENIGDIEVNKDFLTKGKISKDGEEVSEFGFYSDYVPVRAPLAQRTPTPRIDRFEEGKYCLEELAIDSLNVVDESKEDNNVFPNVCIKVSKKPEEVRQQEENVEEIRDEIAQTIDEDKLKALRERLEKAEEELKKTKEEVQETRGRLQRIKDFLCNNLRIFCAEESRETSEESLTTSQPEVSSNSQLGIPTSNVPTTVLVRTPESSSVETPSTPSNVPSSVQIPTTSAVKYIECRTPIKTILNDPLIDQDTKLEFESNPGSVCSGVINIQRQNARPKRLGTILGDSNKDPIDDRETEFKDIFAGIRASVDKSDLNNPALVCRFDCKYNQVKTCHDFRQKLFPDNPQFSFREDLIFNNC